MGKSLSQCLGIGAIGMTVILITMSCGEKATQPSSDRTGVQIALEKTSFAATVSRVDLEVFSTDNDSLLHSATTTVAGGQFAFPAFDLPPGEAEFSALGFNAANELLYEGRTVAQIAGGRRNNIVLTLTPAVPMTRIAPYITAVQTEQTLTSFLEIHNLSRFHTGTFDVAFNSAFLEFESVSQASQSWGTLGINVTPSNNGILINAARPQNAGHDIPAGVVRLLELKFTALTTGTTSIDVEATRIIDAQGATIPEFSTLRTDNQTVIITQGSPITSTLSGTVVDARTNLPIPGAAIVLTAAATLQTTTTAEGRFIFEALLTGVYELEVSAGGYEGFAQSVTLGPDPLDLTIPLTPVDETSSITGTVVDAQSGLPIAGADVFLTGPANRETSVGGDGVFSFGDLPLGDYVLNVSASGYLSSEQNVRVGSEPVELTVALSEILGGAEYRIVLTWGRLPSDLDAHLWTGNYHIFWLDQGSADTEPFILLDIDDTDSFGPETITIYQLSAPAIYAVHNYSGENEGDIDIKSSSANVNVYRGDALVGSFSVPTSGTGFWWRVFDIDGNGNIVPRNFLTNNPPGAADTPDNTAILPGKNQP